MAARWIIHCQTRERVYRPEQMMATIFWWCKASKGSRNSRRPLSFQPLNPTPVAYFHSRSPKFRHLVVSDLSAKIGTVPFSRHAAAPRPVERSWPATSMKLLASNATPRKPNSKKPTASWLDSIIPTATPATSRPKPSFKEVQGAYDVLGDEQKRDHYDRFGTTEPGGNPFGGGGGGGNPFGGGGVEAATRSATSIPQDLNDILRQFTGGMGGGRPNRPGGNLRPASARRSRSTVRLGPPTWRRKRRFLSRRRLSAVASPSASTTMRSR